MMTIRSEFRRFYHAALVGLALAGAALTPAHAQSCSKEDFDAAVDQAGASLRQFNAEANPKLQGKLKALQAKKGWPADGYEAKGFDYIQDSRIASFDMEANELLSEVDTLGRPEAAASGDCAKLGKLRATGEQLLSVMKAKSDYTIEKIDRELGLSQVTAKPAAKPKPETPSKSAGATPKPETQRERWDATTALAPAQRPADDQPPGSPYVLPPDAIISDERGYTIDEIREATRGFFGTISTSLASVIEHAFSKTGRPTAYILGKEGGGAFLAGLRYGKGTLYMRSGGTQEIFWHGPSIGGDIGADGGRTLYLIYDLKQPQDLYRKFGGVDGSAYLVGGVGITFLKGGDVIMAPIRSGLGLRLGVSAGYVRFTPTQTWNPF